MWHAPIPPSGIRRERSLRSLKVHPRPRTPSKISSDVPGDYSITVKGCSLCRARLD